MVIFGIDVSKVVHPVLTNTSGHLIVDGGSPSLLRPINKTTQFINTSLPAGTSTQVGATIPAGETWRMTQYNVVYVGTVAGVTLRSRVNDGSAKYTFLYNATVVSSVPNSILCNLLVSPAWTIEVEVVGATLNDDLAITIFAERVY